MKRRDIQWRAAIPELRASGIKDYPLACKLKHAVGAVQLQGIRDSIGQWGKLHACCQRDDGTFDQSCLTLLEERPTTYIGHTCHGTINVPHWLCSKCNQKVKPNPVALACFPSTPTAAAYWWDVDLHNQYSRLVPLVPPYLVPLVRRPSCRAPPDAFKCRSGSLDTATAYGLKIPTGSES